MEAHGALLGEGIRSRVVSTPSWEIFERQTPEYRESVLPSGVTARVAVEQASTFGWERYVGPLQPRHRYGHVRSLGVLKALPEKFGFEPERVAASARELLGRR